MNPEGAKPRRAARLAPCAGIACAVLLWSLVCVLAVFSPHLFDHHGHGQGHPASDHAGMFLLVWLLGLGAGYLFARRDRGRLRELQEAYRIIDDSRTIILRLDLEGRVVGWNRFAETFFGFSRREILGRSVVGTIVPETESTGRDLAAMIADLVRRPEAYADNLNENVTRDGRRVWVQWTNTSITDARGRPVGVLCIGGDVTRLKETEAALRETGERYRLVSANASDVIWVCGLDLRFSFVSDAITRLTGYTPQEYLAADPRDTTTPESLEKVKRLLAEELARAAQPGYDRERPIVLTYEEVRKDGGIVWVECSARLVFDDGGRPVGLCGSFRDVSERKRADDLLRESEERYRRLVEISPDAVLVHDYESTTFANPAALALFGARAPEELLGRSPLLLVHPDSRDSVRRRMEEMREGRTRVPLSEHRLVRLDGSDFFAETTVSAFQERGRPAAQVILRDVTERKAAQEALRRLSTAVEQAAEIIVITDPAGVIVYVNPAFEKVTGYPRHEAVGQHTRMLKSGRMKSDYYRHLWKTITRGETWKGRFINRKEDGSLYEEEATISPVQNAAGEIVNFVAVKRDVTHLRALEARMRHSQKLESVGQLAAGIAHEINTPAQYVGDNLRFLSDGFADLSRLLESYRAALEALEAAGAERDAVAATRALEAALDADYLAEEIPRAIGEALEGAARVSTIVAALKEFSRPGADHKAAVDLNRAIESTLTVARNEYKYVAELETELDPDLPPVPCVPGDINQVVLHLVVNAAHAIADQLAREGRSEPRGRIRVSTRAWPDRVELRVSDTGCGIPEEIRERVFDPFFTTREVGRGSGQGLALARGIVVEKHGGSLEFESEVGQGTTFILSLPLQEEAEPCPTR